MINKIKNEWHNQYRIAANKEYSEFIYALERGGDEALQFIKDNNDFVLSVFEDRANMKEVIENITSNHESVENKHWFFIQALNHRNQIANILRRKFELTIRFAEQFGFNVDLLSPETFYPALLNAEKQPEEVTPIEQEEEVVEESDKELKEEETQTEPEITVDPEVEQPKEEMSIEQPEEVTPKTRKSKKVAK